MSKGGGATNIQKANKLRGYKPCRLFLPFLSLGWALVLHKLRLGLLLCMGMILLIGFLIPWGVIRGTGHHDCFVVFSCYMGLIAFFLLVVCLQERGG